MGNKKFLIVEENDVLLKSMFKWLQNTYRQFQFFKVESGLAALEILEHAAFDIVIVDIDLPDMTASDLIRTIISKYPQSKIIGLTMFEGEEFIKMDFNSTKPIFINKRDMFVKLPQTIRVFMDEISNS